MLRIITLDEAIKEISEVLAQTDGDFIIRIYNEVTGKDCEYKGDSLVEVDDS